ncbi:MAG: ethanolamine utilization protein EutJ [Liquorilactobacillus nagelii]|uniref:ethanolamine utilization protein EutJ n=1 Tax=Liquorilactobacillus nagelii TaxID=82688 RepID=UPI0039EA4142
MLQNLARANSKLDRVNELVSQSIKVTKGITEKLRVGIDLGTSSIVLVVINEENEPVFSAYEEANVVKDGLVVDFMGAISITRKLKLQAENELQTNLDKAAGAVPPGTEGNNKKIVSNVIEAVDLEVSEILDEPVAAAFLLNISDGIVVDVGGGTTGITIIRNNNVVFSADQATGGDQMTLVIAGFYDLEIKEAEKVKRMNAKQDEVFRIIRPVVEKIASIIEGYLNDMDVPKNIPVFLVGGATCFLNFPTVLGKILDRKVYQPHNPRFVTPLGIAIGKGS